METITQSDSHHQMIKLLTIMFYWCKHASWWI